MEESPPLCEEGALVVLAPFASVTGIVQVAAAIGPIVAAVVVPIIVAADQGKTRTIAGVVIVVNLRVQLRTVVAARTRVSMETVMKSGFLPLLRRFSGLSSSLWIDSLLGVGIHAIVLSSVTSQTPLPTSKGS